MKDARLLLFTTVMLLSGLLRNHVSALLLIGALVLLSGCYRETIVAAVPAEADDPVAIVAPDPVQTHDGDPGRPYDLCDESVAGAQAVRHARCPEAEPKAPNESVRALSNNVRISPATGQAFQAAGDPLGEGRLFEATGDGPEDDGDD